MAHSPLKQYGDTPRAVVDYRAHAYNWDVDSSDSDDEIEAKSRPRQVRFGVATVAEEGNGTAKNLSKHVDEDDETILIDEPDTWRRYVHETLTDPTSSRLAFCISMFFFALIILSTITFMLETLPVLSPDPEYGNPEMGTFWFILESVFVGFFTLEFAGALLTAKNKWEYLTQVFSIIDLLAILPYYIELVILASGNATSGVNLRFLRIVRLVRVFRVLKMGKQYDGAEMLYQILIKAYPALIPPFFMLFIGIVFFASIMYICEQGEYDPNTKSFWVDDVHGRRQESTFQSIPESLWWAIVTTTTVGYGDSSPHTGFGKVVASCTMIFGILFSAMPIAIIGSTFTDEWEKMALRLNATKSFRKNTNNANTSNWGANQLSFFKMRFAEESCTTIADFLGTSEEAIEALRPLDAHERPSAFVSRRLTHELLTNRDRIEQGVLPPNQWNLAYKLYHIMRAESSKCESNIETYTLDFIAELYHVLGLANWDEHSGVHFGFRSRAGLTISFGNGRQEKTIRSDSELGVYTIPKGRTTAHYFLGNEAKTTSAPDEPGRIAGELLALAQNGYETQRKSDGLRTRTVFVSTFRGYHVRFYAAEFPPSYLEAIRAGKKPDCKDVVIRSFPPRLSLDYNRSTMNGTLDLLTPSHREDAVELFVRMKRMLVHIAVVEAERRAKERAANAVPIPKLTRRVVSVVSPREARAMKKEFRSCSIEARQSSLSLK
eukprot:TRINITY_DN27716_c0_g1_i1.p1 TRINITY_DN27716_c0_g1~~TRINITY_DN27716_c0_g1_i1.p1  ORF type:complete len:719 (+),score=213.27 TRINITY_DN27716_c0_g1_i1:81-2237(+)